MTAPKQPALIDEQLRKLRGHIADVRKQAKRANVMTQGIHDAARRRDSVLVEALVMAANQLGDLSAAAEALADAVADLDASVLAGNALPSEWRDPGHASVVDRLTWICVGVWSRVGGITAQVKLLSESRPEEGEYWLAVCDAAPRAVYGATPPEALRRLALYGAERVARVHGEGDPAVGEAEARLVEIGLGREPGETVAVEATEPPAPPGMCRGGRACSRR